MFEELSKEPAVRQPDEVAAQRVAWERGIARAATSAGVGVSERSGPRAS